VYLKRNTYYFVDRANKWHRLSRDYFEALQRYAELNLAPVLEGRTLDTIIDRYLRDVVPTKAVQTQRDNTAELARLRAVFGHMAPGEITPQHIYGYMDARRAPVRANREKALLSHVYKYAIRWGYAADNPCRLVESNKEKPRDRYVTDDEFWRVHDRASAPIQMAMQIAVATGLRLSDILALDGSNITRDGLLVRPHKTTRSTGRRLLFRWTPELRAILGVRADDHGAGAGGRLVRGVRGQPLTRSGFQSSWQRLMRSLFAKREERFTFHDLRAKAGSDSRDGRLLGHADQRTLNRHYRRKPEVVEPVEIVRWALSIF